MLAIADILDYLNDKKRPDEYVAMMLNRWRNLYFGMSMHTSGAAPAFQDLSNKVTTLPIANNNTPFAPEYSTYLGALRSLGFDYTGFWIFPPNFQGWEYHFIFDKIIFSRHPREPEDTRQWRFSQYVPITQGPCGQLNEVVTGAIFQDSNYTIEIDDKENNNYIQQNNFSGYDLIGYISNIGYKNIVEDANGFFLRIPKKPFYEYEGAKPDIDIWFVNSKEIVLPTDDFVIFRKNGYGWYIDKQVIYRFKYDRENKKYILDKPDANGYYAHLFGRLPITKAGGIWNTHGYYESYYYKAKPIMDDFCRSYSARQLVDKEASHPFIIEPNVDCVECNGTGSFTVTCDTCPDGRELRKCASCGGMGKISRNPGQHMVVDKEDFKNGVDIKIVNPNVEVNKNLRETVRELMDMILEVLHLNKQKTDTAQSGIAKAIDQERLYKFVSTICNDLFDKIIPDILDDILAYRNVRSEQGQIKPSTKPYKIVKPTQFQIKTAEDLLTEYKTASEANLPKFILQKIALDYIDKQYSGDEVLKRKGSFIICYDPIAVYSTDEKISLGTPEQITYSEMLPVWLDEIIKDKGNNWFINAKDDDIIAMVEEKETEYVAKNESNNTTDNNNPTASADIVVNDRQTTE